MAALANKSKALIAALMLSTGWHAGAAEQAQLDPQAVYQTSQAAIGTTPGDYILRDRTGKPVRLSSYRGKPLLVSFVYTGCFQVCPSDTVLISKAVNATQDLLGTEAFHTVTIGFNAPFDSPEAMASFSRQLGVTARNWEFLSPDLKTVAPLTRDFGFSYLATPKGFDHITQLSVLDRSGRIYRQLYGDSLNAQAIVAALRDIDHGVVPVPSGWSGVLVRVRLLCTVYDGGTGTYRANYGVIVGLLVGASILGSVAWMLVSEWRRQRKV
ncbi:SCO family protein [Herbaspirillum sp. ST 5-3]|uniref:SCO family protein n=1 Tax=Oxalobacteraceae TaxID=75682 RepID=UPI0010A54463|nr:SCO family protein [Herbaspirillum sp. ST 5-3]